MKHGQRRGNRTTAAYRAYCNAVQRCTNPKCERFARYGGRGIKILFKNFEEFFSHLGPRPRRNMRLDRINPNGNYERGNVRWVSRRISDTNKGVYKNNTTGVSGVKWHSTQRKYNVVIHIKGKRKHLGCFTKLSNAIAVRRAAEAKLKGGVNA